MNNEKIAGELVRIARDLTAGLGSTKVVLTVRLTKQWDVGEYAYKIDDGTSRGQTGMARADRQGYIWIEGDRNHEPLGDVREAIQNLVKKTMGA